MRSTTVLVLAVSVLSGCASSDQDVWGWKYDTCHEARSAAHGLAMPFSRDTRTQRYGRRYVDYRLAKIMTLNATCFPDHMVSRARDYLADHRQPAVDE